MLVELHQIKTKDGLPLEGLLFKPKGRKRAVAVWLGGLTSRFSHNPDRTRTIANSLTNRGIAFAVFDHRGLGIVNNFKIKIGRREKYLVAGTSFEKFEHCVLDIEAIINFFRRQGYSKIFLLGHSTGANKIAYYIQKKGGRKLNGVGLLAPLSDIPVFKKDLGRKYRTALIKAGQMVRQGRGRELLPPRLIQGAFWSAERFWSIAREKSNEDIFPYYDAKRKFRWAKKVRIPVLVLIGEKDQYADRPTKEILEVFQIEVPNRWFTGSLLRGTDHGFTGKERELARKITDWAIAASRNTKKINR